MLTVFDPSAREAIHERVDRLSPEQTRQWGSMQADQMVCHAADQLRVALGDIESRPGPIGIRLGNMVAKTHSGLLRFRLFRQLMVHRAPWPKARIMAPPEMFTSAPAEWQDDVAALHVLIDRAGEKDPTADWAVHPMFGPLSGDEWGMLCWKHLDHHLRQFGV